MSAARKSYVADALSPALAYVPRVVDNVSGPEDVVRVLAPFKLAEQNREHVLCIMLNTRHNVISIETISIGSMDCSIVHPREVFRAAIKAGAASIILAHNHPSGNPEPSNEDYDITRRLHVVGNVVGITLLDHYVLAAFGNVSLRERSGAMWGRK